MLGKRCVFGGWVRCATHQGKWKRRFHFLIFTLYANSTSNTVTDMEAIWYVYFRVVCFSWIFEFYLKTNLFCRWFLYNITALVVSFHMDLLKNNFILWCFVGRELLFCLCPKTGCSRDDFVTSTAAAIYATCCSVKIPNLTVTLWLVGKSFYKRKFRNTTPPRRHGDNHSQDVHVLQGKALVFVYVFETVLVRVFHEIESVWSWWWRWRYCAFDDDLWANCRTIMFFLALQRACLSRSKSCLILNVSNFRAKLSVYYCILYLHVLLVWTSLQWVESHLQVFFMKVLHTDNVNIWQGLGRCYVYKYLVIWILEWVEEQTGIQDDRIYNRNLFDSF